MRWYSALICSVPVMMAALGPNLNFLDTQSLLENLQPEPVVMSEFRLLNERPETIIIPEQENLSPEDDSNQKFILYSPEFFATSVPHDSKHYLTLADSPE